MVFEETTNSVSTVKNRHDAAGLCSPLQGEALIAALHGDVNVGEHDDQALETNAPQTDVIS